MGGMTAVAGGVATKAAEVGRTAVAAGRTIAAIAGVAMITAHRSPQPPNGIGGNGPGDILPQWDNHLPPLAPQAVWLMNHHPFTWLVEARAARGRVGGGIAVGWHGCSGS